MNTRKDAALDQPERPGSAAASLRERLLRWEALLVLLILGMGALNTRLSPHFLNSNNLLRASSDFVEIGLLVLPMVYIIVAGNIDLSIASTLGLSASLMGWLFMRGTNIWLAVLAALVVGALAGLLNGLLVARLRLPALVVTIGTLSFYRGLAFALLGDEAARGYPPAFTYLGQGQIPGTRVPFALVLLALLALVFGLVLHRTIFGRYLFAIGNNEAAARYSGVPVRRVRTIIFVLSGLMAALAGIILAARYGSTRPDIGSGLELIVITVTVLGGISIFGGSGTLVGALLALVLVGIMRFGMGLVNLQGQVQDIVMGLLLIVSILVPRLSALVSTRVAWDRRTLGYTAAALAVALLFGCYFFWSRALILGA